MIFGNIDPEMTIRNVWLY